MAASLIKRLVVPASAVLALIGIGGQTRDDRPMPQPPFSCLIGSPSAAFERALARSLAEWKNRTAKGGQEAVAAATVKTYVHVIRNGKACPDETLASGCLIAGDPGNEVIIEQFKVLNNAFSDAGITFSLDTADIERVSNASWFTMTRDSSAEEAATAGRHGDVRSLNIYTALPGGYQNASATEVGWARYPPAPLEVGYKLETDHVVIPFDSMPGASTSNDIKGYILIHEVAHWLGVLHTFENGCKDPGDKVDETTPEAYAATGCPANRQTCRTGYDDPVTNLMDSTTDKCKTPKFVAGQIVIILTGWQYRLDWP